MNASKTEKKFTFLGHKGPVYSLEQGPAQHLFYSAGSDRLVVEWNLLTKEPGLVILTSPYIIYSLKYHSTQNLLFAGQANGGIHIVDLAIKKEIKLLAVHKAPVFDLTFSLKNNLLLSAGGDGNLVIISLVDFRIIKAIHIGNFKIRSVVINTGETMALIGCQDGSMVILNLSNLVIERRIEAHKVGFSVFSSLFISEDNFLISGSRDACLNVFDVKNDFSLVASIPAHNYAIYHILSNKDNTCFATASRDKSIKIWDPDKIVVMARLDKAGFDGHINSVNRLLWTPFNTLISCSDDRSIIEWDVK